MAEEVKGIQGEVLKWAREQAGYALQDVAEAMKKDIGVIEAWEQGSAAPTYSQLEKLAYQLYKRPLAIFFFPSPPQEPDLKTSFRTLPQFEIEALSADTRYALRYARAMQLAVTELNDGVNRSEKKIFADLKLSISGNVGRAAAKVRQYLGISLEKQINWRTAEVALAAWRDAVEEAGIFVFKRSFKQKDISGFCVYSEEFPLIYLNNSTAKTRQIFSLFHELAHILFQVNGVTKADDSYIDALPKKERDIEIACNRFAAEFLVPSADFDRRLTNVGIDYTEISSLADLYKVSREVILRKLLDRGLVSQQMYKAKAAEWSDDYLETQKESAGGNYYRTQATYLGAKYLGLVFSKYYQGHLTLDQAADYLGVKTKNVAGLEQVFVSKAATA